eukprot:GILK01014156.1.p1 GENE.GILK01014156.1~~GILK01014156.1.p1  ORF type:complete len:158 (-),score=13.21 GILK01014156.1:289-723(-)
MESSDLRDRYRQRLYREVSSSMMKDEKDAAHTVSLELACFIQETVPGPQPVAALRKLFNLAQNFRMVKVETNRSKHRKIDMALMSKYESGECLTQQEHKRAARQVEFFYEFQRMVPDGFLNGAAKFYKGLRTVDGATLWKRSRF